MTLKQLEYLTAVIDTGSISAAADKMHISQPPLSMQIKYLEEELGVLLFERTTRYIRPTDAGHKLYDKARAILDMVDEAESELTSQGDHLEGTLTVGTISSCGNILLGPAMTTFISNYPDVHFQQIEGNTYTLLDRIKKHEIDLAFVRTPFDEEDLQCLPLVTEPMCAVGVSDLLPDGNLITLTDLSKYPLIIYRRFEKLFRNSFKYENLTMNVNCVNDDARTTLMWAAAGLGVGIMPRSIIALVNKPELIVREIDYAAFETQVHIVYRKGQYLAPAVKKFIEAYR